MEILAENLGKRFNRQWIFKGVNYRFASGSATAITGNNGSGKSTFLQVLFGFQEHSAGKVSYLLNGSNLPEENLPGKISFAAPYLELPEEFTLQEALDFHFGLVPLKTDIQLSEVLQACKLAGHEKKFIKHFSSGMKQRLKLILAIYSNTPALFLDEPCTNLDDAGIAWYQSLLHNPTLTQGRTLIVASNQAYEYEFCSNKLQVVEGEVRVE